MAVSFLLDGKVVDLDEVDPTASVLDYLRYDLRRTGTKEGCAEGDCGACTVLVGSPEEHGVAWRAVNACIQFLPMLHGKALMTVESLRKDEEPTPLQVQMAANGSSQCGFCTPGFVMSLHGRTIGARGSDLPLEDVIAGNLCRCTGYGPILEAGEKAAAMAQDDGDMVETLRTLAQRPASGDWQGRKWFAPRSVEELSSLLKRHPEAHLVAGATDVGLWVTKGLRTLDTVIFIGDVAGLDTIEETDAGLTLGATARYGDAHAAMAQLHPDLGELVRRLGGLQVRNAGTVGGNIANGSPIGDGPPPLIALGASLTLRSAAGSRTIALEDFFLDYGKQDLCAGEFVEKVHIPRPGSAAIIHIAKLSRRFDSDISAVCGAIAMEVADGTITSARVAFGGMAATPRRAQSCEQALAGQPFAKATLEAAAAALTGDFTPLDDVRGSSAYRIEAAGNLLRRLWLREQGACVSVLELAAMEAGHG